MKEKIYNILRWSEKYTKTDMVYLTKGGSWLALEYSFQVVSSLFLAVAFANLLPKEAFGTYQFIIAMASIVSVFTLTGMSSAIMRSVARGTDGALRYGLQLKLTWSIGIVLASGGLSLYYFFNDNQTLAIAFLIVGAFQPLISSFKLYGPFLVGKKNFQENSTLNILQKLLPFILLLLALFLTKNPLIIVAVYFIANATSVIFLYRYTVRKYKLTITPDPELKSYSKHLSFMESFLKIAGQLDKILMWHFLGAASVAIYTIAQMPVSHIKGLFNLGHPLTFPKFAKKNLTELKIILPKKITKYFFISIITATVYIVFAPFLFSVFFPIYSESVFYSQLLALAILVVPKTFISQSFISHQMKKELYISNISTSIIRIILIAILLPIYGITGAIIALIIAEFYETALLWFLFRRLRYPREI